MSFDDFVEGVFAVLASIGTPTIQEIPIHQRYGGRTYNFDAAHSDIRNATTEAFYYCEQNRFILRPPPTNVAAFLSHGQLQITRRGQDWANSVEPVPEDYNGYMKQFDATTDVVVRQYISEALNTFMHGSYFASAVMIGAASEKAIYLLADSLIPAIADSTKQSQLRNRTEERKLDRLLSFIERIVIEGHDTDKIPYNVMERTTRHLLSLFEYIKVQRNDAIHPLNFQVSADSVRFSLNAFPLAFQKVEALQKWCSTHPSSL